MNKDVFNKISHMRRNMDTGVRIEDEFNLHNELSGAVVYNEKGEEIAGNDTVDFSSFAVEDGYGPYMLNVNLNWGYAYKYVEVDEFNVHRFGTDLSWFRNIIGSDGNDILRGDKQGNVIVGKGGKDNISGGEGDDLTIGGSSNTTYAYFEKNFGHDIVIDEGGERDVINLANWHGRLPISVENILLSRDGDSLLISFNTVDAEKVPEGSITIAGHYADKSRVIEILRLRDASGAVKDYDLAQLAMSLDAKGAKQAVSELLTQKTEISSSPASAVISNTARSFHLLLQEAARFDAPVPGGMACHYQAIPSMQANVLIATPA
ncbi:MAG: hypothetical protein IT497_02480 [Ottowia sp.]|nr:hypothetical protein [Ottowia sp.]